MTIKNNYSSTYLIKPTAKIPKMMMTELYSDPVFSGKLKKEKMLLSILLLLLLLLSMLGDYGIDLLYSLPSKASLYISATYGFFAGVSAPNSTRRAYTLTTYARAPMKATTTPMLNIQWLGTANISSSNLKCHSAFTPIVNMVAK